MPDGTRRSAILLVALCAILLLPAAACRGLLGMEFRAALFVRELLRDGPALVPRLDGEPYFDYPPLYFLAAALSSRLAGAIGPLSLALPSVLAAIGTVLLVFSMTERERPGTGLAAGAALAVTPLFLACASQGNVDAVLAFFVTLAAAGCRRYLLAGTPGALAAACLGIAGAALTKGPVGIALPLGAVAAWLLARGGPRGLLGRLLTLGLFLAALLAFSAAAILLAEGREFLGELVDAQLLDRIGDPANQSRAYYLWVFLGGLAPWSLLALRRIPGSIGRPFRRSVRPGGDFELFCACWLLAVFVLLTLANIKHSRYLLPAAPPVAVLAASAWDDLFGPAGPRWAARLALWIRRACLALLAAGAAFAAAAPFVLPAASRLLAFLIPAACLAPLVTPLLRDARGGRGPLAFLVWTMAAGFLLYVQFDLPRRTAKDEARPFVRGVEEAADGERIVFYDVDEDADGLKFRYWRMGAAPLAFTDSPDGLIDAVDGGTPPLLVVPARERGTVERELGPRLRFLFEGRLGKRRCAVYGVSPASAGPENGEPARRPPA